MDQRSSGINLRIHDHRCRFACLKQSVTHCGEKSKNNRHCCRRKVQQNGRSEDAVYQTSKRIDDDTVMSIIPTGLLASSVESVRTTDESSLVTTSKSVV